MRAVVFDEPGDESVLAIRDVSVPPLKPTSLRIAVASAGVNRADLLQRRGLYGQTAAATILGLECAGTVLEVGAEVFGFEPGQRVMALLPGGGYAEEVVVDAGSVVAVPQQFSDEQAGGFMETFLTAYLNIFQIGGVDDGGSVLVHGGGSGVGTSAIRLCNSSNIRIIVTAGSAAKCARCLELGANVAINYNDVDFASAVNESTGGRGVDAVVDCVGGPYFQRNLDCLKTGGRLALIGLLGGAKVSDINLGPLLLRGLTVCGLTLRSKSVADKAAIIRAFRANFGAALDAGELQPVVDTVFGLDEAAEAHRRMQRSEHFGKLILRV